MFTLDNMRSLLNARPFVPFRLWLRDGGHVDVLRGTGQTLLLRDYAIVGVPDPNVPEEGYDQHVVVWYNYVARHEVLLPDTPLIVMPHDVCFPHQD